ncbi:Uncharacterised protein [Streptococcus pneumoniae]|nr:Uncharacterised protein [Streptococcus pneumoniae]
MAKIPLTLILPLSATSFATVRRLIIRDTFKYLSNLILITSIYYCTIFIYFYLFYRRKISNGIFFLKLFYL